MRVGIDSYCYHHYFGEIYSGLETDPGRRFSREDFLEKTHGFGVAGVSPESCFFPAPDARLATDDLIRHIAFGRSIGADVMRLCCGGRRTRPQSWVEHRDDVIPVLRWIAGVAAEDKVVLAIENHIDLLADEMIEQIEAVDSPWLGVCLDTANNLRMLEDPLEVARKLVPYARAMHIEDIVVKAAIRENLPFGRLSPLAVASSRCERFSRFYEPLIIAACLHWK
jgi:3-oxoisoapionate decarboxylase